MQYTGEISALATAVLWAFTSLVFAKASLKVGSVLVNISRLVIAEILIIITVFVNHSIFNPSSEQLWLLIISGIVGLVIGDGGLFKAFETTGPRIGMLFLSLAPAISSIIAYFYLGEVMSYMAILGAIITLGGILLVVLTEHNQGDGKYKITPMGLFYCTMGAVGQGFGLVAAKKANMLGALDPFVVTGIRIFAAIVVMLPFILIFKKLKNPFKSFAQNKEALKFTLIGSIIGPYISITLSFIAISLTQIGVATTLMATTPIVMLPLSHYVMKEKLNKYAIIGSIITVLGVALLFVK